MAEAEEGPHGSDEPQVNPDETDPDIKSYKNTGITVITERKVEIGPDGRRRALPRRKILTAPPKDKEQK
ncbi:MAG: hypothetical protein JO119_09755 [Acidobacteria bacterium]|nr:hypothetical protein [Acidobacteriota bacterium]